jgi:hypothetical protein
MKTASFRLPRNLFGCWSFPAQTVGNTADNAVNNISYFEPVRKEWFEQTALFAGSIGI